MASQEAAARLEPEQPGAKSIGFRPRHQVSRPLVERPFRAVAHLQVEHGLLYGPDDNSALEKCPVVGRSVHTTTWKLEGSSAPRTPPTGYAVDADHAEEESLLAATS